MSNTTHTKAAGQIWYVAKDLNGFTAERGMAMVDKTGTPVICPGDVNRTWNAEYKRIRAKREAIWTKLLDTMETAYELEDGLEALPNDQTLKLELQLVRATMEGIRFALGILELPPSTDREQADDWVIKQADIRYEREAG